MKLRDFLKQFEGCDPETEMDSLDIWTDVLLQEHQFKANEYSEICSKAFDEFGKELISNFTSARADSNQIKVIRIGLGS